MFQLNTQHPGLDFNLITYLEMLCRSLDFWMCLCIQVVELQADLAEENTTATQASEMLETESAERMRLEKELKDVQV